MKYQKRNELLLYAAIWVILFVAPILSLYARAIADTTLTFKWDEVFHEWKYLISFFIVFLVHNFFVAPLLVYRKRRVTYFTAFTFLMVVFVVWQYASRPVHEAPRDMEQMEEQMEGHEPPPLPDDETFMHDERTGDKATPPPKPSGQPNGHKPEPPIFTGQHDLLAIVMMLSMIGINIYMKFYFRFADERKRLKDMEKENLEHQLEYLKYQINPHFFMNTLNNIHALVDIDPERAKTTILELSKLMRFVLYEGAKPKVPLQKEIAFVNNYIQLMRIRYADNVRIKMSVEEPIPDREVAPLLTIAFVENAFKHGISYKKDSFVSIHISFDDGHVFFTCRNSMNDAKNDEQHGGVGLENVRRRLKLIYGSSHTLKITEDNNTYNVELTIPI